MEDPVGRIEVQLKLSYLVQDLLISGWMQTNDACLVDNQGNYLAHAGSTEKGRTCLPDHRDPVRMAVLRNINEKPYGIIIDRSQVIGFYRLTTAPLAIFACR